MSRGDTFSEARERWIRRPRCAPSGKGAARIDATIRRRRCPSGHSGVPLASSARELRRLREPYQPRREAPPPPVSPASVCPKFAGPGARAGREASGRGLPVSRGTPEETLSAGASRETGILPGDWPDTGSRSLRTPANFAGCASPYHSSSSSLFFSAPRAAESATSASLDSRRSSGRSLSASRARAVASCAAPQLWRLSL